MIDLDNLNIQLTDDEIATLQGKQGPLLKKVMETVVLYGEALRAEKLVDIEGPGHFVISWSTPGIAPPMDMLEELVSAGLRTTHPFTLDPRPPLDFENLGLSPEVEESINEMYQQQNRYDELMVALGLRDENAYTCNPYQPEIGNRPEPGTFLAWSESACAIYANSVLGARTNRNGAIIDLLSNIVGKTPYTGLLTDEGRKATWLVQLKTKELPNPQLLGAVIGQKVFAGIPYITGLEKFLGKDISIETSDYLQEMGAACATYGAVDLFHVEHITPEAVSFGRDILLPEHTTFVITDETIHNQNQSYPMLWSDEGAEPEKCYIGCPHISYRQINWWSENISLALKEKNQEQLAVETVICAAPQVLEKFKKDGKKYQRLIHAGVNFSPTCSETIFETGLCDGKPILTNSNKLRAYTSARFYPDEALLEIIVGGEETGGNPNG
jgi:predicted aconitase